SGILIISSFQTIQNVRMLISLEFKKRSFFVFVSNISGVIGGVIIAFFFNLNLEALVAIPIITCICQTILYVRNAGFYFKLGFNRQVFKDLMGFGVNTTSVSIINLIFDNIYQLVIGKVFSLQSVGYYYQAKKMQDVPNNV